MDYNKKKRRRTKSVQDMYGIGLDTRPSTRPSSVRTTSYSNYTYKGDKGGSNGGIGLTIFGSLLVLAIIVSCVFYFIQSNKKPFVYPTDVLTISGVLTDIYGDKTVQSASDTLTNASPTDPTVSGQTAAIPGTTDPAAAVDSATSQVASAYPEATSHEELLTQIDSALAAGDTSFITTKFLCKNPDGSYIGYSIEAINAFTAYMSANPDKRAEFITSVADANTYSTVNQEVYYLTLPKIVFSINIGYADTTVSITSFSDVVVDGTEVLEQGPLLPMVYKFTVNNATWKEPSSQDIDVKLDKAVIGINVGK